MTNGVHALGDKVEAGLVEKVVESGTTVAKAPVKELKVVFVLGTFASSFLYLSASCFFSSLRFIEWRECVCVCRLVIHGRTSSFCGCVVLMSHECCRLLGIWFSLSFAENNGCSITSECRWTRQWERHAVCQDCGYLWF